MVTYISTRVAILLFLSKQCLSQRKILNGEPVKPDATFTVYLVETKEDPVKYDSWICGGTIVTLRHIITSAACVEDVQRMYAVGGYNKYVHWKDIESDECTKNTKKKIIMTCVPKTYTLDYDSTKIWSTLDIAVAKTDIGFDSSDYQHCSYQPTFVDYDRGTVTVTEAADSQFIYGWGSKKAMRQGSDKTDSNSKTLMMAKVEVKRDSHCTESWPADQKDVIEKYMVCSTGALQTGFCQNDHGGPLITMHNSTATLTAVMSTFLVNEKLECKPPFLYVTTRSTSAFLDCVINATENNTLIFRNGCNSLDDFQVISKSFSW